MVTRETLGIGYIMAVGVGLFGALASGILLPLPGSGLVVSPIGVMGLFSGVLVAGAFTYAGVQLAESDISGDRIWRVAKWSTVGLGVPTALVVLLGLFRHDALVGLDWRSVAIIDIAGGGVVGILVGALTELQAEHSLAVSLNQRNAVFHRLLRHDMRTRVTVLRGYLDLLEPESGAPGRAIEVLRSQVDDIERLSEAARQLDDLESDGATNPVDLVSVVDERIEAIRAEHPSAAIAVETPESAVVRANDLLTSVVDNVVRNAVEHQEGTPRLTVAVSAPPEATTVAMHVRDEGPGFSANELAVHDAGAETTLRHSSGVGLWLTRWITEAFGGTVSLSNRADGGAEVTVELPAAALDDP